MAHEKNNQIKILKQKENKFKFLCIYKTEFLCLRVQFTINPLFTMGYINQKGPFFIFRKKERKKERKKIKWLIVYIVAVFLRILLVTNDHLYSS